MALSREAETLVPVDQIVGKEQQMKVRFVGGELNGGYLGEGVVGFQLLDNVLHGGAIIVEPVDSEGPNAEVSHEGMVAVPACGEERGLRTCFLGQGLAHDHKAIGLRPAMGLILTFGDRQLSPDLCVSQSRDQSSE